MTVRDGKLWAEVWQRANGTWSYAVCPGERPKEVDNAIMACTYDWYTNLKVAGDGFKDKKKRWWRRDHGTGEERAIAVARTMMSEVRERMELQADERRRRRESRTVTG